MHLTSLVISFLWEDSLDIFYDVSLHSSGRKSSNPQEVTLDPLSQGAHEGNSKT